MSVATEPTLATFHEIASPTRQPAISGRIWSSRAAAGAAAALTTRRRPERSSRLLPGALEPLDQRGDRLIHRRGHALLLAEAHDPAVQRINLGGPLGQHVLEHARPVLVGHLDRVVDELVGVG